MPIFDLHLILASAACWALAALAGAAPGRSERGFLGLSLLGALLGLAGGGHLLAGGRATEFAFQAGGLPFLLRADALSGAFLLPLHLVAGLGAVYGRAYWPLDAPKGTGRSLRAFTALLAAAMTLLFVARQGLLFLLAWELMAVSAFFLIGTEHERSDTRRAAWTYLVATHTGTAALTAMVILLARRAGGLLWLPVPGPASPGLDAAILVLALIGFGFKAGLLLLHFWLPGAHAGAPSHVSALLSAVMLKAGIYGLLRVSGLLPAVPGLLGGIVLALGAATAIYGALSALAQGDYKRLLAYSSIENLGIIAMGVGLGLAGRSLGAPKLVALGFGAAIFHVWNHSVFKSLLFFGAGAVLHATGTRDMEALGGLAKRMPRTALSLLPGVLAVAALPPFGAFVSEWFLYRGLFAGLRGGAPWSASLGLPALALTGGLAAFAAAKFFGILFLGSPRSAAAEQAHDPRPAMGLPMALLALLSLALGFLGLPLLPWIERALAGAAPGAGAELGPLLAGEIRVLVLAQVLLLVPLGALLLWLRRGPAPAGRAEAPPTWDCGYAAGTARMQYTGGSFGDTWASALPGLGGGLRKLRGPFPRPPAFQVERRDVLGLALLEPRAARLVERALRLRRLQPGFLSIYLLYVLVALLGVFAWMLVRPWLLG